MACYPPCTWDQACVYGLCSFDTPVLIDVSGDGFRLTDAAGGVNFDIDGDGAREKLSWSAAGSDDAFLCLDRNGNGTVDNGQELFGNYTPQPAPPPGEARNGFLALAEFDRPARGGNGDGAIDGRDAIFNSLRLWRDASHDGVAGAGELHALPSLGVNRIELAYREARRRDRYGNVFRYRARAYGSGGAQAVRWAYDVFLARSR